MSQTYLQLMAVLQYIQETEITIDNHQLKTDQNSEYMDIGEYYTSSGAPSPMASIKQANSNQSSTNLDQSYSGIS